MAVTSGMFLFEVVVDNVRSLVESRNLVIRSDFADIFSLELKDPKQMHIVIPEPPPLPPEPPAKKGKKAKPKKPKKGKKGKKGAVELPPPEPCISSGQSVLFSSSAEFLIQTMLKFPLEVSLWSKEDNLVFIGASSIPWDTVFVKLLEQILKCEHPLPVTVKDDYNVFEEETAKIMAKLGIQIKLTYLTDKVTTAFRTLSEDPTVKKVLYTGINSKTTSYICTMKTTDEEFEENCNKIANNYTIDKPKPKIAYADYKNAPGANLTMFKEGDYCCMTLADKPPDSLYKAPETCPDIDFIVDYVRKIIVSCNDNMRMLTPRPTIRPRVKATDIDRLCYCKETQWPDGKLASKFKKEAQSQPCPMCINAGKRDSGQRGATFDIGNIRGPCGKPDCRIAREMRAYIEKLVEEDNQKIDINQVVGPCGSKECSVAEKIQQILRREGPFREGTTQEGLASQCACLQHMQKQLTKRKSYDTLSSDDSENDLGELSDCPIKSKEVYQVYYFTVQYDFDESPSGSNSGTTSEKNPSDIRVSMSAASKSGTTLEKNPSDIRGSMSAASKSGTSEKKPSDIRGSMSAASKSGTTLQKFPYCPPSCPSIRGSMSAASKLCTLSEKFPYCPPSCPSIRGSMSATSCNDITCSDMRDKPPPVVSDISCNDMTCSAMRDISPPVVCDNTQTCPSMSCPDFKTVSPADSDVIMNFSDIKNPCCMESCNVAEMVKDFVHDGIRSNKKRQSIPDKDPCYCDCECSFKFPRKTSYCSTCGGYECLGYDMMDQPEFLKPHPCPIYHKMYDRKYINVPNPFPDESPQEQKKPPASDTSAKSGKGSAVQSSARMTATRTLKEERKSIKQTNKEIAKPQPKQNKKTIGKFTANVEKNKQIVPIEKKQEPKYPYPSVPKNRGWNWTADDIPGLKPRPKWKPGAVNKILVRKYRAVREGGDVLAKKKRALMQRKKKIESKPTLIVKKVDGEYTVQMEVLKKYSKERLHFQYPYDEKPPLIYTIGKTEEEKRKIQKQRERRERRETRRKSRLIQSTFRDKCHEICLKAYNQAIGLMPLPEPNNPLCPCETETPIPSPAIESCSCSDDGTIDTSDTDGDDWVIEFTPPAGKWDVKEKHNPHLADSESQYSYLDYKVKVLDKSGNQVPRFFKGQDGKQECSDLGGFWGPGHVWMEINKDGYIGPDNRWVPMNFTGPDGMFYSAEDGVFTDSNNKVYIIGVDGYIDKDGKWASYSRGDKSVKTNTSPPGKKGLKSAPAKVKTEAKTIATLPEIGGKLPKEKGRPLKGEDKGSKFCPAKNKPPVVMTVSTTFNKINNNNLRVPRSSQKSRLRKVDSIKLMKYREILRGLGEYENLGDLRPRLKTDRASNTNSPNAHSPMLYGDRYTHSLQPVRSLHKTDTAVSCCPYDQK